MDKVLIDTDVFIDFFFDRKPFSDPAAQLLNLCAERKIEGYTTPVIICNVYYLLRKTAKHILVVERLKQLLTFITIINMDQRAVMDALDSEFKDFEDALKNFAAIGQKEINIILTRNIKDFRKTKLAVMSPETYLKGK